MQPALFGSSDLLLICLLLLKMPLLGGALERGGLQVWQVRNEVNIRTGIPMLACPIPHEDTCLYQQVSECGVARAK